MTKVKTVCLVFEPKTTKDTGWKAQMSRLNKVKKLSEVYKEVHQK